MTDAEFLDGQWKYFLNKRDFHHTLNETFTTP